MKKIKITDIANDHIMEMAFSHIYKNRSKRHHNDDIWHVAFYWDVIKPSIIERLKNGCYQLSPMCHYQIEGAGQVGVWCAEDAIVLKAIAMVLQEPIKGSFDLQDVSHIKGNGGLKGAVTKALENSKNGNPFVYKTDVKDFYQTIDHQILLDQLKRITDDLKLLKVLQNYCERVDIVNGEYLLVKDSGIPKGCSLSPLMAAIYLHRIDQAAEKTGVKYIRYMDDLLFISDQRWKLKRLIKKVHGLLTKLKQSISWPKTWIGRDRDGFDWLGFHVKVTSITVALKSLVNHKNKVLRLKEQGASETRIEEYCLLWKRWVEGSVGKSRNIFSTKKIKN